MRLNNLKLRDFRNYSNLSLDFDNGVNLIVGENAQGKTNLLEAIAFLGTGKSFRAQKTGEMIRFNADFADINGDIHSQQRDQELRWVLFPGAKPRQLYHNGIKKRSAGEISGVLPAVLFCPEDLGVLKAGAAQRRRLGDQTLCQLRPNYDAVLQEYNRVIEQKSRILKDRLENPAVVEILPEYNARLCHFGAHIISYRARFYEAFGKAAAAYHHQFSGETEEFVLQYHTVSTVSDPFAPVETIRGQLEAHLQSHYRAELESVQCLTGPHKDDFSVSLNNIDLKAFGSQGQTRTSAISLKLAQRQLLAAQLEEEPLLLLDDVLSELDAKRQDFILNQIDRGQVFITCCEPGRFTKLGKTIEIEKGMVKA